MVDSIWSDASPGTDQHCLKTRVYVTNSGISLAKNLNEVQVIQYNVKKVMISP